MAHVSTDSIFTRGHHYLSTRESVASYLCHSMPMCDIPMTHRCHIIRTLRFARPHALTHARTHTRTHHNSCAIKDAPLLLHVNIDDSNKHTHLPARYSSTALTGLSANFVLPVIPASLSIVATKASAVGPVYAAFITVLPILTPALSFRNLSIWWKGWVDGVG